MEHELEALDKVLAAYSDEKVKEVRLSLKERRGGDISLEEIEKSLRENELTSIADDLKDNLEKSKYVTVQLYLPYIILCML